MAMSKEDQKAASDRIMAKLGPFSPQEAETYRKLTMKPPYPKVGEVRVCNACGAEFATIPESKGQPEVTAMQQFVDHISVHNPNPAQWAEAHQKIQTGKEWAKSHT